MQNISAADFFTPTPYNSTTKEQIWMSQIADGHDNICDCKHPFAHLLANIFPPGHKDRDLTINKILQRDYTEKCLSGGGAGAGGLSLVPAGTRNSGSEEKGYVEDQELEELIAAGESAATER